MRVSVYTVDEFLECLTHEQFIFDGTIRVSIIRNPVDADQRRATKFDVKIQASAVVEKGEHQYLLEIGQMCGIDYEDDTQERDGSEVAISRKNRIQKFAEERGWKVLPGIISE